MLLTILNTALSLTTLVVLLWVVHQYIKARRENRKLITLLHTKTFEKKMDDLLDGLLANETEVKAPAAPSASVPAVPQTTTVAEQRDRLAIIAAGGQARKYLGKSLSLEEIDKMDDDEVRKIYTRYEARLGVCMTKTLGKAALQLCTTVTTMFLPVTAREPAASHGGPRVRPDCRPRAQQNCLRIVLPLWKYSGADHRGVDHG